MLQHNERFQNDVKSYTEAIEKMSEGQAKDETTRILNDLIYEVKNMDNMYLDMVYGKQLQSTGGELREKIASIRKKLEIKIKTNKQN
jgi:hypothetical protein